MRHSITIFTIGLALFSASFNLFAKAEEIGIAAISVETNIVGKGEFAVNDVLHEGDEITTGSKGTTTILFNDESMLTLGPNARAYIETYHEGTDGQAGESIIRVSQGQFRYFPGSILENGGSQLIAVANKFYGKSVNPQDSAPIISSNNVDERSTAIELTLAKPISKQTKAGKKNSLFQATTETTDKQSAAFSRIDDTDTDTDTDTNSASNQDAAEHKDTQSTTTFEVATSTPHTDSGSNTAVAMCPTCPNSASKDIGSSKNPPPSTNNGAFKLPNDFTPMRPDSTDDIKESDFKNEDGSMVRPVAVEEDSSNKQQHSYSRSGVAGLVVANGLEYISGSADVYDDNAESDNKQPQSNNKSQQNVQYYRKDLKKVGQISQTSNSSSDKVSIPTQNFTKKGLDDFEQLERQQRLELDDLNTLAALPPRPIGPGPGEISAIIPPTPEAGPGSVPPPIPGVPSPGPGSSGPPLPGGG